MKSHFGMGIYTISDTSEILNVPKRKVRYWFNEYVKGQFDKRNEGYFYVEGDTIAVNFFTLIETYVFYHLKEKGVKTKKIIEAHNILSKLHNTSYPFALKQFLCSGGELFHRVDKDLISLDKRRQYSIEKIILQLSENIDFQQNYASKYYPRSRKSSVVVNPNHQYGTPIIDGTNIKVSTLLSFYRGGEEPSFIASLYSLKEKDVQDAIKYATAA